MPGNRAIDQIRRSLEAEGAIFYPKRKLAVPSVDPKNLGMVNPKLPECVDYFRSFLGYSAVGDHFGMDHNARREWRRGLVRKYGPAAKRVLVDENQLRDNLLGMVRLDLMISARILPPGRVSDIVQAAFQEQDAMLNGKAYKGRQYQRYPEIADPDVKLGLVQECEDRLIIVMGHLNSLEQN